MAGADALAGIVEAGTSIVDKLSLNFSHLLASYSDVSVSVGIALVELQKPSVEWEDDTDSGMPAS